MGWLKDILGGKDADPGNADAYMQLAAKLGDYPPDPPPHPGDPLHLTDLECDANLTHMLASREQRLAILASFLKDQDIDIAPALNGGDDAQHCFAAVQQWLAGWLPKRPMDTVSGDSEPNPPYTKFMASDRSGAEIYLSFFSDLALLEGEAIRKADSQFDWEVNRWPGTIDLSDDNAPGASPGKPEEHPDYRNICLVRPSGDPANWPTMLNLHRSVQYLCHAMMSPIPFAGAPYGQHFTDAKAGNFNLA